MGRVDGINAILSPDGILVRVNARFGDMVGVPAAELLGRRALDVVAPDDRAALGELIAQISQAEGPMERALGQVHRSGRLLHVVVTASTVRQEGCAIDSVIVQVEDTTARRLAERTLTHQATHDALTALPNRTLLTARLRRALDRMVDTGHLVALLFCDVDHFKRINDSLGPEAGDQLLVDLGQRLRQVIGPADTAARLGGDEFVIIVDDLEDEAQATAMAARVCDITAEPFVIDGLPLSVSLSIGVAYATAGEDPSRLIHRADSAMYEAKGRGRGRYEVYDDELRRRARARLRIETHLRAAIPAGQLRLWSQPVVRLPSAEVVGREALVRWAHPELGLLAQASFLDIAEEADLIVQLGTWVIEEACRRGSRGTYDDGTNVAINISASQMRRPDFAGIVRGALQRTGLDPSRLVLELTEHSLLQATAEMVQDMHDLEATGVAFGIDDFGTGWSSLTYLQALPVRIVKIDRSFTAGIVDDARQRGLAKAVVDLGAALGLDVVAEGVETAEQAAILTDMGCPFAQGYHFGRPHPMAEGGG